MQDFLVGGASSILSSSLIYPIDVVKTQYQITGKANNHLSVISLTKNIFQKQGIRGFYKGVGPYLSTYPVFWAVFFASKNTSFTPFNPENYDPKYKKAVNISNNITNSLIASTAGSFVANPLFVIKTRYQANLIKNYSENMGGYTSVIRGIYLKEGVNGFMKGLPSTLVNNMKIGIQFPFYDYLREHQSMNVLTASFASKFLANTCMYPFELIRVKQRSEVKKVSLVDAIKNSYNNGGFSKGLYRGFVIYNVLSVGNFVSMMVIRDKLNEMIDNDK